MDGFIRIFSKSLFPERHLLYRYTCNDAYLKHHSKDTFYGSKAKSSLMQCSTLTTKGIKYYTLHCSFNYLFEWCLMPYPSIFYVSDGRKHYVGRKLDSSWWTFAWTGSQHELNLTSQRRHWWEVPWSWRCATALASRATGAPCKNILSSNKVMIFTMIVNCNVALLKHRPKETFFGTTLRWYGDSRHSLCLLCASGLRGVKAGRQLVYKCLRWPYSCRSAKSRRDVVKIRRNI